MSININKINEYINKYINQYNDEYFIIYNGKLIPNNTDINKIIKEIPNGILNEILNKNLKFNNIEIIARQKGGAEIWDIFPALLEIAKVFIKIGDIIIWLGKFVWWLIQFIGWMFMELLNPLHLANEFLQSLLIIVIAIIRIPFDLLLALFVFGSNTFGMWMQGFWGWDQSSLSKKDKESNYFKKINIKKGTKTYLTNSNTVPFSIILGTILCPPMGVFMDMGLTGWLNIIICCLLTIAFYVPGLVYALLIIYS